MGGLLDDSLDKSRADFRLNINPTAGHPTMPLVLSFKPSLAKMLLNH